MIEVIYKEEKQETADSEELFTIPRNIRQIGFVNGDCRIYIEDYVYTFLGRTASAEKVLGSKKGCVAVFTGEIKYQDGIAYIFIRGAVLAENMEAARDHIDFSEDTWADIHNEQEKYFPEQEIVGWFFAQPEVPVIGTEIFSRAHMKNFGGEKVLMILNPVEREDGFFCYENGELVRQKGYYVYYEKNPLMQTYMIDKNPDAQPEKPEETGDEAVKSIRKIIKEKKKQEAEEKPSVFSYAATVCLAAAVLAVGVNFYQDYKVAENRREETAQVSAVTKSEKKEKNIIPTPTVALSPTAAPAPVSERLSQEPKETENDRVYQEEADVRKARRRKMMEEKNKKQYKEERTQRKKQQTEETAGNVHESYVIRPGDTLYQISVARYGNTDAIKEICRLNGITEQEIIYPGQVIVLP